MHYIYKIDCTLCEVLPSSVLGQTGWWRPYRCSSVECECKWRQAGSSGADGLGTSIPFALFFLYQKDSMRRLLDARMLEFFCFYRGCVLPGQTRSKKTVMAQSWIVRPNADPTNEVFLFLDLLSLANSRSNPEHRSFHHHVSIIFLHRCCYRHRLPRSVTPRIRHLIVSSRSNVCFSTVGMLCQ